MSVWVWAHIVVGVSVLVFAIWRLAVRFGRGVPAAPAGLSKMMVLSGEIGHWALYALMFIAPITGLAAWFGGVEAAAELHGWLKPVIIVLVVVHIAAALWHQFIRKDGLLLRMGKAED
jgi:cytochrome b561